MALQSAETLSSLPVPNFDGFIKAAADQLGIVKLKTSDSGGVTTQRSNDLARLNVPNLDSSVVGASCQDVVVKLKTSDTILVALESLDCAAPCLPVEPNFESVTVDVLPRAELALVVEMGPRMTRASESGSLGWRLLGAGVGAFV
jgi:hypothetical protein